MCLKAVLYRLRFNTLPICAIIFENIYCNKRDSGGPVKLAFHNEHIYHG